MQEPRVPPEKRPSVSRPTDSPKAGADERARHAQHLAHAGTTARAFVADDHDVARVDAPLGDGRHRVFLALEDARWALLIGAVGGGDLDATGPPAPGCPSG